MATSIRFTQLAAPIIRMLEYRKRHLPFQHPLHIMFYDQENPEKTGQMAQTVYLSGEPGERNATSVSSVCNETRSTCRAYTTWSSVSTGGQNNQNYLYTDFMYHNLDADDALDCPVRGTAYLTDTYLTDMGRVFPICGYSHNLIQPDLRDGELGNENGLELPKDVELFFAQNTTSCIWIFRAECVEFSLVPPDLMEMMTWNERIQMWSANPYGDFYGDFEQDFMRN